MERQSRAAAMTTMKAESISKHVREHANSSPTKLSVQQTAQQRHAQTDDDDVAVLVQRDIVQKLKDGEARVTVQHGLQAQMLIDRRSERAKDRELSVTLARLLHTAAPPSELVETRPLLIEDVAFERVSDG